ncbi:hypothetical protein GCWU000342_00811 [Shuttleworthella satelles DSM 14600]|uniref:Uncharacterized protein n=1 Tax=Shuttleworthella satelles DSM 14600 TaxID=626523 RepID=C4GA06_9FIRM|nr:hypothetical protein GCWU000342_00811 [Shuttleworthia satelles DSM 14600]
MTQAWGLKLWSGLGRFRNPDVFQPWASSLTSPSGICYCLRQRLCQ